ncbi:MAG: glycosyltransferase family 2 protein [Candidatus Sericytochromatia bacterium]
MSLPKVSIILRNKNSEETMAEVLKALYSQDFDDFELIVMDSGSRDKSLEWVQPAAAQIYQLDPADYFPGKVLNQAAQKAQGEILVFLNSDVVMLNKQVLTELLKPFADEAVVASFARQVPRPEADPWVRRDYTKAFPSEGPAPRWMTFSLPLAAMRKKTWQKMPFYTWAWGSEDSEWGHRALQQGLKIAYVPQAEVMHSHNYTLKQLYGRRFIEGEADAYMQSSAYPLCKGPLRVLADSLRDLTISLKQGQIKEGVMAFPRRLVFHLAHYRGWCHGWKRLQAHSQDASKGQVTVLQSHPAA